MRDSSLAWPAVLPCFIEKTGNDQTFRDCRGGRGGGIVADFEDGPVTQTREHHVAKPQFGIVIRMAAVEDDVAAIGTGKRIGMNQLQAVISGRVLFLTKLHGLAGP